MGRDVLLRSTDGGSTWTAPTTPGATELKAVHMPDADTGVAVLLWGGAYRTTDGGANWSYVPVPGSEGSDVHMVNSRNGWIGGRNLYQTTDGGLTWQQVSIGTSWPSAVAASDLNHVVVGRPWGGDYVRTSSIVAALAVPDYGSAPNSWAPSAQGMFGACLQAVGAQTTAAAPWAVDGGTCTASDGDPWRAVPAAPQSVARVSVAGNTGSIDLVWGLRIPETQAPGQYSAGVVFEVVAPAS